MPCSSQSMSSERYPLHPTQMDSNTIRKKMSQASNPLGHICSWCMNSSCGGSSQESFLQRLPKNSSTPSSFFRYHHLLIVALPSLAIDHNQHSSAHPGYLLQLSLSCLTDAMFNALSFPVTYATSNHLIVESDSFWNSLIQKTPEKG